MFSEEVRKDLKRLAIHVDSRAAEGQDEEEQRFEAEFEG